MTCHDCEDAINKRDRIWYYRVGYANIGILACEKHFIELRNAVQAGRP